KGVHKRATHITKRLRRIPNARHFRFDSDLVFTALWFKCGGLRCSPLNAALYVFESKEEYMDFKSESFYKNITLNDVQLAAIYYP
ncbi:hypothetical protein VCHENC02_5004B, partial [Vibrio harveyi]